MTIRTITPGARKNYIARIESATATGDYTRLVRNIRWAAEAGLATGHMATASGLTRDEILAILAN